MALGTLQAWGVILPVEKRNELQNPSLERGTTGWAVVGGAASFGTLANPNEISASIAAVQTFGAWGGDIVPDAADWTGAAAGTWTSTTGSAYSASLYISLPAGSAGKLMVGTAAAAITGASIVGSIDFTGGGTFHRYSLAYTEPSTQVRRLLFVGTNTATQHVLFDGAQVELGSITTYLDGDQPGCYWLGVPHNSASVRSGTYRGGGSVVSLADLGLIPSDTPGIGMPPLETTSQSFALLDGAQFQRQRAKPRTFSLNAYIAGRSRADLHAQRQTIIDALKIDRVSPQQPTRFWYVGGRGTVQIDAVMDAGMEYGAVITEDGFTEHPGVRFIAHDPFWYSTTDQGASFAARTALGSTNFIAQRDNLGRWGTLGIAGTTVTSAVNALLYTNGTLFIGGAFGTAGGTRSGALARYDTNTNRFGTLGGTVQSSGVNALVQDQLGTIYLGGAFTNISGLSNTRFVAQWTSAGFGTITGGTTNNSVAALVYSAGTLFLGGQFTGVAGTTFVTAGQWTTAGYGSLTGGTVASGALALAVGLDGRLFITGDGILTAGGTTVSYIAQWDGAFGTLGAGLSGPSAGGGAALTVGPNGILYVGGGFGSAGGGTAQNVASWNGVQFSRMADGLGVDTPGGISVTSLLADPASTDVYAAFSQPNTGSRILPDSIAYWNGYIWLPFDIDFQTNVPTTFLKTPQALYIGGAMNGTAQAASVTQVFNVGRTDTYPVFTARLAASSGTARIYQLVNTLTGDGIYFNYSLIPGEQVVFDFQPGARSFVSSARGNIYGAILPGSDIASFRLAPGTNWISFFADNDNVQATLSWRPRSWSADAGTAV